MNDPAYGEEVYAELSAFAPPLVAAARARIGQDVVVHFSAGFSVDGDRLLAVNDDETITIDDQVHRFDIALGSVAVIEGSRS